MERGAEQDYYELEMILGEKPNMTYGNPYSEEHILPLPSLNLGGLHVDGERRNSSYPGSFNKFYNALQAGHCGSYAALYNLSSLGRSGNACLNSSQCPFDKKNQNNGNLDGRNIFFENDGQSSTESTDGENLYLPDDKSLTSAFTQLSFADGLPMGTMNSQQNNNETSQNHTVTLEAQQLYSLKKSLSRLDSGNMGVTPPQSPSTLNGKVFIYPSSNGLRTVNETLDEEECVKVLNLDAQEPKKQKPQSCQSLESGDLVEKRQSLLVYSGTMPFSPRTNPFHVAPNIYDPAMDLSVGPYQQQRYLETHSDPPFVQPQHVCQSDIGQKHMEEEWYRKMQQQYLHLQRHWNQGSMPHHLIQANADLTIEPITRNATHPYFKIPISHQLEQINKTVMCNDSSLRGVKSSELTLTSSALCRYYSQGFCGRGKSCPFAHGQNQISARSFDTSSTCFHENSEAVQVINELGKCSFPEKARARPQGLNSPKTMKAFFDKDFSTTFPDLHVNNLRFQPQKFQSLDDFMGRFYPMAKDQYGCRFLQRKLAESNAKDVEKIFIEIVGHIAELMVDPFGNYLVQKLLEVCNENQRTHILHAITRNPGDLVRISLDGHGTRAVQRVIETISNPEHFAMVISSLKPGILILMKDSNGSHVIQRCLQYFMPQFHEFIFETAIAHCVVLGKDRHGCCVLQKCLSHSDGELRHHLVFEITSNALILSHDRFGNYVVQYIFELQIPWAAALLLKQLEGNYGSLSMQKCSSNVVERCLKHAGEARCSQIVQELISSSQFDQILQDPYGNYVIQAALNHSKGASHAALVEAIRPHIPALRTSPYGKKVLSNKSLKK